MTTELGAWFENNAEKYTPWKASSVDSFVCHEILEYVGGYGVAVEDGQYDRFPLTRAETVKYAYRLYMDILPKGHRYQTKQYYEDLAEKVVRGYEDAYGVPEWLKDGEVAKCLWNEEAEE